MFFLLSFVFSLIVLAHYVFHIIFHILFLHALIVLHCLLFTKRNVVQYLLMRFGKILFVHNLAQVLQGRFTEIFFPVHGD